MFFYIIVSIGIEDVSQSAVDAGYGLLPVKIDVDLGVAQGAAPSVTGNLRTVS